MQHQPRQKHINIFSFTNDTLFTCKAGVEKIVVTKSILICFELAFGLQINFHRSYLGVLDV